jgi:hypothetical protein
MALRLAAIAIVVSVLPATAQDIPLEYRVKAAYLNNFVKYVEWPPEVDSASFTICVAGRNPFGDVLADTVRGERVDGRPIVARVISDPDGECRVVFVPRGVAMAPYLPAPHGTLTVGETTEFTSRGGVIAFVQEGANVRFEINDDAAMRAGLRISSRLLRLSRTRTTP